VFVTLTEHGELRGCIGTIMPVSPLVQAVASNALSAAFSDPRFEPVEETEFADLHIEVSLLSVPAELAFSSLADLHSKLAATRPGVILQRGVYQATFLPQVWEELPNVGGFLQALCHKAGLHTESLSQPGLSVFTYTVEAFSETCE
jgi:AmmeMemoRadiSam system protein A